MRVLFNGKNDDYVHSEFMKFGKGKFENRYLVEGKKQKERWGIKTSSEFANYLVERCLSNIDECNMSGAIITTHDLRNEIKFNIEKVKQFAGVRQHIINTKVKSAELLDLMKKYPRAFYALSFSTPKNELKIKAKPPRSGKASTKGNEEPKADFCSLKTSDHTIVQDLFFDFHNFNQINIKHTVLIENVILPKGVDDPIKIREMAKKKGKIIRYIKIDGKDEKKEADFEI